MAPNDSAEPASRLTDILDYFWSSMDKCKLHDHSHCRHFQDLGRRTRPHMLAYFSSPPEEGTEGKPDQYKPPQGSHYLSKVIEDSHTVENLELTLKATAELRTPETKNKAIKRLNQWPVKQLTLMNAEKRLEDDRRSAADSCRDTMQELLKLHNDERDKWKMERDKWKVERDTWKLTCKRLKDEACVREQQLRKLTMESQRWKAEFARLASTEAEGKNMAEVFRDLLEQLRLERQNLDLQRRTGDTQKVSNSQAPTGKLERSSNGICGQLTQSERDKQKGKHGFSLDKQRIKPEVDDWVSQQQLLQFNMEKQRWQAESAKLRTAESEGKKLEEVCRDLLDQLEQRNVEIRRSKVELQKASKWHAVAQQQMREQREEIKKLKKTEVAECIICTNEFGQDLDRQRAYWKDCNHANICYKCTKTLWTSKSRQCPTCKTPASSMPTRLPPKIYL